MSMWLDMGTVLMTNTLYRRERELVIMPTRIAITWALAILAVAVLNILDVLPDWTTFAAVVAMPAFAVSSARRCAARAGRG